MLYNIHAYMYIIIIKLKFQLKRKGPDSGCLSLAARG